MLDLEQPGDQRRPMALFDWLRPRSPLQPAIRTGMAPGGDLAKALGALDNDCVRSRADGEAVCAALRVLAERKGSTSPLGRDQDLSALLSLFQNVEDTTSPGFRVLVCEGIPLLGRFVNDALDHPGTRDPKDLLFAMKVLVAYGSDDGSASVIRAAQMGYAPEDYLWSVILRTFSAKHPHVREVFAALTTPIPSGFIGVSVLDAANAAVLEDAAVPHPFDSDEGVERLRQWLSDPDPDVSSYGVSASAALPHLRHPRRDELLSLALDHPAETVRLEAAWAAGKCGRADGIRRLVSMSVDIHHAAIAQQYLAELGRTDAIPREARDPAFVARAEFATWLAHPNELGRPPDEVEVLDHRSLTWPPEFIPKHLWLLRYLVRDTTGLVHDDIGVGLVGGQTFCLFSADLDQRPPEDGYAIHCCWELERQNLVQIDEVRDHDNEYEALLGEWVRRELQEPKVVAVAEVDPKLRLPCRIVTVGLGTRDGVRGWFVSDGTEGGWYPETSQPVGELATRVLQIHIGRRLLGFGEEGGRKGWLRPKLPIPPEQIVAAYEKLLPQLTGAAAKAVRTLFDFDSLLVKHFDAYLDALPKVRPVSRESALLQTFELFLAAARRSEEPPWPRIADKGMFFSSHFEAYVDALAAAGRRAEIAALAKELAPVWDHNLGYGLIGRAAFLAGDMVEAERLLLKLQTGLADWERCEEMPLLAEIWVRRGETTRARELLLEALLRLAKAHGDAECGGDIRFFAARFRMQRDALLRLLPDGDTALAQAGVPTALSDSP